MQIARPAGREAASRKYDILTALAVHALSGDKTRQRRVLRLMALVTARYNWQRDELSLGQVEIARLWSVDPRTVKREMAALRAAGWLVLKRQGSRGRVSLHGLGLDRILSDTRPDWANAGPDLGQRLAPGEIAAEEPSNVVPLRPGPAPTTDGTTWAAAQARLHAAGDARYGAWLGALVQISCEGGCLTLAAPSRFHASYVQTHLAQAILAAVQGLDPSVRSVQIDAG